MPDLPQWVLKYKAKGVYVQRKKDGYYLFRAHSQRIPGKKNPKLVYDGYIGKVTEEKGLVAAKPPLRPGIKVLRYGWSRIVLELTQAMAFGADGQRGEAEALYPRALLEVAYGECSSWSFKGDWLSEAFPDADVESELDGEGKTRLARLEAGMGGMLERSLEGSYMLVKHLSSRVYLVDANGRRRVSEIPEGLEAGIGGLVLKLNDGGAGWRR